MPIENFSLLFLFELQDSNDFDLEQVISAQFNFNGVTRGPIMFVWEHL